MGNLEINRNVYHALVNAAKDNKITAAEMQEIYTEMEASGGIDQAEQAILQHLENKTSFTVRSGIV